jgi:hypothetical protein
MVAHLETGLTKASQKAPHEALNSRRAILKDLGALKAEKAMWAQLLGERERKGSGGAGSLP